MLVWRALRSVINCVHSFVSNSAPSRSRVLCVRHGPRNSSLCVLQIGMIRRLILARAAAGDIMNVVHVGFGWLEQALGRHTHFALSHSPECDITEYWETFCGKEIFIIHFIRVFLLLKFNRLVRYQVIVKPLLHPSWLSLKEHQMLFLYRIFQIVDRRAHKRAERSPVAFQQRRTSNELLMIRRNLVQSH